MLQRTDEPPRAVVQRNAVSHPSQGVLGETFEQHGPLSEAVSELQLTAHGALRNPSHLLTDPVHGRQLVDDLRIDERGVHVERHQPTVAPVYRVLLHTEIECQALGGFEKARLKRPGVIEDPTKTHLYADPLTPRVVRQRQPARQASYGVDVETVVTHDGGEGGELLTGGACGKERDYVTGLALTLYPVVVVAR